MLGFGLSYCCVSAGFLRRRAWIKSQNAASNSIKGYRGLDLPEALKDCSPDGRHIECDPEARMSREQKKE